jgi:hypothetical protein
MSTETSDIEKIITKSSNLVRNQVINRGISLMMFPIDVMKALAQDISAKFKK